MSKTAIDWTDYSWNPVSGCTAVSEGCRTCYAKSIAMRFKGTKAFPNGFAVTLHPERVEQPLHWRDPKRVFLCSMGDLFHEDVPDEFIEKVFGVMGMAPQHTFQVLTKRPDRMLTWFAGRSHGLCVARAVDYLPLPRKARAGALDRIGPGWPWPLPNVHIGVTAENQEMADERIPLLLQVPAAVRFVSVEPMLGPVDLGSLSWVSLPRSVHGDWPVGNHVMASPGIHRAYVNPHGAVSAHVGDGLLGIKPDEMDWCRKLDWVIAGGETGPGARPMNPDWVGALADQCQAADVPFFFKGWGEWLHESQLWDSCVSLDDFNANTHGDRFARVGKKAAGHLLDGQLWRQFPEAQI